LINWLNSSSKVTDINNNTATDDKFVFITFKEKNSDDWVVYLDTNGDGTLNDEKPLKNFKINKIQSAARQRYFNQSMSYLEYRNIINYFPEYKNETVNIVLNSINNIDQAVKAKNAIPELKTKIRKQVLDQVDDLYSAKLYNDNFLVNNDKLKVIKKLKKVG